MDFRKATNLFADADFDGDPVQIYQPVKMTRYPPDDFDGDPETDSKENDTSFEGGSLNQMFQLMKMMKRLRSFM